MSDSDLPFGSKLERAVLIIAFVAAILVVLKEIGPVDWPAVFRHFLRQ